QILEEGDESLRLGDPLRLELALEQAGLPGGRYRVGRRGGVEGKDGGLGDALRLELALEQSELRGGRDRVGRADGFEVKDARLLRGDVAEDLDQAGHALVVGVIEGRAPLAAAARLAD